MSQKEWLAVGLAVLLGTGFAAALPGAAARSAGAESVVDDGPVTDGGGRLILARWGDQSGENGIEAPRWGDQSGEQGEIEAPRA